MCDTNGSRAGALFCDECLYLPKIAIINHKTTLLLLFVFGAMGIACEAKTTCCAVNICTLNFYCRHLIYCICFRFRRVFCPFMCVDGAESAIK